MNRKKRKTKTRVFTYGGGREIKPRPVPFSALRAKVVAATVGAEVPGPHSKEQSPPVSQSVPACPPSAPRVEFLFPILLLKLPLRFSRDSPLLFRPAVLRPHPICPDLTLLSDTLDPIGSLHLRLSHSTARSRAWPPRRPGPPSPFPTRRLPFSPAPFLPPARLRPGLRAGSRTHRTRRCTRSPRSSPRTSPAWKSWGPSSPRGPPPEPSRAPPPRRSTGCAPLRGLPGRLRPGSRAGFAPRPPAPGGGARCRH